MHEHTWHNLSTQLGRALPSFNEKIKHDPQFLAFTNTDHISQDITFAIKSAGSDDVILFTFNQSTGHARVGKSTEALFSLVALPTQWESLFKKNPVMPYQSFWALYGQNIRQEGAEVQGDQLAFAQYAHIWRVMIDVLHDSYCGANDVYVQQEQEEDFLTGKYVFVQTKNWGRCKIFYETSGSGDQEIVFLHTAGSDSRQYHGVMNDPRMRARCSMVAFDLPSHGRSFPSPAYPAGGHFHSEEAYIDCIAGVIRALKLNFPIICGASMAGQACIAAAINPDKVGIRGAIPMQGYVVLAQLSSEHVMLMINNRCERVEMERVWHDKSPVIDSATFNPEWVYGVSPISTALTM